MTPIIDGKEADAAGRERSALLMNAYLSLSIANGYGALQGTTDPRERDRIEGHMATINRAQYEDPLEAFSPDVIEAMMNLAGALATASDRGVARHRAKSAATKAAMTGRNNVRERQLEQLAEIYREKSWALDRFDTLKRDRRQPFVDKLATEMKLSPSRVRAYLKIISSVKT